MNSNAPKWKILSDDDFIKASNGFSSQDEFSKSFGLKGTNSSFAKRLKDLNITFQKRSTQIHTSGIYAIFSNITDECLYVGQSSIIENRWKQHQNRLKSGRHRKEFVEWFISNNSDISSMRLVVLEKTKNINEIKNEAEIRWFTKLMPKFYGQVPSASKRQWNHSNDTKTKISESTMKSLSRKIVYRNCKICGKEFSLKRPSRTTTLCSSECVSINKSKFHRVVTDDKVKRIISMYYDDGMTGIEIAKHLNIDSSTVYQYLRKHKKSIADNLIV